jgi:hypothetical protein
MTNPEPEALALVIAVEQCPEITINEVLPPGEETASNNEADNLTLTAEILFDMMRRFWRA